MGFDSAYLLGVRGIWADNGNQFRLKRSWPRLRTWGRTDTEAKEDIASSNVFLVHSISHHTFRLLTAMSSPTKEQTEKVDKSTPPASPSGAPKSGSPPPSYDVAKASPNARSSPSPAETPAVPESGVDKEAVKELSAMFPIIDAGVIEAVLESTGSKDAAVEHLLGMTDPSFVPDAALSERERQASLDADFAQALHFQDRQDHADRFPPPPRAPPYQGRGAQARAADASRRVRNTLAARLDRDEKPFDPATYVPPYQPRVRKPRAPRHGPSPYDGDYARAHELQQKYGEEDVQFTELEKKVLHIAEQGKQTFSSLINRAKAKYDEFSDQRDHGQNPESSTARTGGLWGAPRP